MNTYPFDTLRDTLLKFVAEGMTYDEALSQFDEKEFTAAAMAEMDQGLTQTLSVLDGIELAGNIVTNDERRLPSLFDLKVRANFERSNGINGEAFQQALQLWQAGWTSEHEKPASDKFWSQVQVMSWYWRAPSKRLGKLGRKYLSTNQAFNAMRKAQDISPSAPQV